VNGPLKGIPLAKLEFARFTTVLGVWLGSNPLFQFQLQLVKTSWNEFWNRNWELLQTRPRTGLSIFVN
jgi:hypothetical protein